MADSRLGKPSKKAQRLNKVDKMPVSLDEVKPPADDGGIFLEYDKPVKETISKSGVPRVHKKQGEATLVAFPSLPAFIEKEGLEGAEPVVGSVLLHLMKNEMSTEGKRVMRPTLVSCRVEKLSVSGNRAHVVLDPAGKNMQKVVMLDSLYRRKAG